jgi:hypothetical protein
VSIVDKSNGEGILKSTELQCMSCIIVLSEVPVHAGSLCDQAALLIVEIKNDECIKVV